MKSRMEPAVLEAIASPRRREILRLVWREEQTAGAIHRAMPDVTFGAVSTTRRPTCFQASRRRARREAFGPVAAMLESMWDDALWKLKLAAELEESRRGPKPKRKRKKRT